MKHQTEKLGMVEAKLNQIGKYSLWHAFFDTTQLISSAILPISTLMLGQK
jgi:hypothetical protein